MTQRLDRLLLLSSAPSFLLLAGYLLFYSQVLLQWWRPEGVGARFLTFIAAVALAGGFAASKTVLWVLGRNLLKEERNRTVALSLLGTLVTCGVVVFFLALKPAHLPQESDFANYHLALTRQNWLWASWAPAEWYRYSFISLLLQFGYSAFWVGLPLLNKLPQLLLVFSLFARVWLVFYVCGVKRPFFSGALAAVALIAFRGIAIQFGTAMLDLPTLYFYVGVPLLFVGLGRAPQRHLKPWLTLALATDLVALIGHKSFGFIFVGTVVVASEILARLIYKRSIVKETYLARGRLIFAWFAVPFVAVLIPNLVRSAYYTGDAFFPVLSDASLSNCNPTHLKRLGCAELAQYGTVFRDLINSYGYGHGVLDFIVSFFRVPFAWDGPTPVNNKFDYPLGAFWFVGWGALLFGALREVGEFRRRALLALGLCAALYCLWFAGSQQSRWLYPALLLMALFWPLALVKVAERGRDWGKLAVALTLACCLFAWVNGIRMVRAQRSTLACFGADCLSIHPTYQKDYREKCPAVPIIVDHSDDHGYLSCRIAWSRRPQ